MQVMSIGVTYDQFWHGEPDIVRFAIEANEIRQKNDAINRDVDAWNTGRYVMVGVGVVLSQAFSKNSQAEYPPEPLLALELNEQLAEQKRERELMQQHNAFLAVAAMLDRQNQTGADAE